jgi:thioredoxin-related protein
MIKQLISILAVLLASCAPPTEPTFPKRSIDSVQQVVAHEPEIMWEHDLIIGLSRAITEDKLVLLFFYHNYCEYCVTMVDRTFADEGVKKLINSRFITIKINTMESPFAAEAGVTMVPTLVVVMMNDSGGEPVFSRVGFLDNTGMSQFLTIAMGKANDVRIR